MLAPVLPKLAGRVARELFGMDRDFVWSDAWKSPERVRPFKHLMQRVDAKQMDALIGGNDKPSPQPTPRARDVGAAAASASPSPQPSPRTRGEGATTQPSPSSATAGEGQGEGPTISID